MIQLMPQHSSTNAIDDILYIISIYVYVYVSDEPGMSISDSDSYVESVRWVVPWWPSCRNVA